MKFDLCFNPRPIALKEVHEKLPEINLVFERYGISMAYIYGSILLDGERGQDVDIGIYIKDPKKDSLDYYTDVYFDICDIFRADNIDVAVLNNTGFAFRYEVIKTGRPIYSCNPETLTEFIEETLFFYEDMRSLYMEHMMATFSAAREGILMYKRRIDKQRLHIFFTNMERSIKKLQTIRERFKDVDDFLSEEKEEDRDLCIHYLRLALEALLDICRHIIAARGLGIPDMEKENLIDVLGREGVIPSGFARRIRGMQGMRNAIVHVYWNLSYEKVYEMIKLNLKDFEDFVRYVLEFVEKGNGEYQKTQ